MHRAIEGALCPAPRSSRDETRFPEAAHSAARCAPWRRARDRSPVWGARRPQQFLARELADERALRDVYALCAARVAFEHLLPQYNPRPPFGFLGACAWRLALTPS